MNEFASSKHKDIHWHRIVNKIPYLLTTLDSTKDFVSYAIHKCRSLIVLQTLRRRRPGGSGPFRMAKTAYFYHCTKIAVPLSISRPPGPVSDQVFFGICAEKLRFKDFRWKKMTRIVRFCVVSRYDAAVAGRWCYEVRTRFMSMVIKLRLLSFEYMDAYFFLYYFASH